MILKKILPILLLSLLVSGCGKARFDVVFDLPESMNTSVRLLYYASSKKEGLYIEQEAILNNGKCNLTCTTARPCIVFLYYGSSKPQFTFYAERGDKIEITGKDTDPLTWSVSGNSINEQWSEWRHKNIEALRSGPEEVNKKVAEYVKKNPGEKLSALLLLCQYYRLDNDVEFRTLWMSLDKKVRDDDIYELLCRSDLMSEPESPSLSNLILRTKDTGCDTLRFKGHPSLLFFWNNGQSARNQGIDTLQSLSRAYPDEKSRTIADICLEPDSLAWIAPLHSDSLENVTRGWMPLGQADKWALQARIAATPSFIVSDKKGNVIYCGPDSHKASTMFRGQMQKQLQK